MATVTFVAKQAGVPQLATGSFTSDNAAQVITLGFRPSWVKVVNETDAIVWEWIRGMASTKILKMLSHDTAQVAIDTGSAIVDNGDGTITLSATAVGNSKAIKFIAAA
jgi:hypothetical protein